MQVLSDEQWSILEPIVEACRPKGKTPPRDLRRTIKAILWRCDNGAKWRAVPSAKEEAAREHFERMAVLFGGASS